MSPSRTTLDRLVASDRTAAWRAPERRRAIAEWTDDHASVVPMLKGF